MSGPLAGLKIVEVGSIGPGPFAAMMLADHGAMVTRVQRPRGPDPRTDAMLRSRDVITLDLKAPDDIARLLELVRDADGLIEGFRPGTMERLDLGPERLLELNPRLVYGRLTGWGQTGPLAPSAGHDINYISISGALHAIGPAERPVAPPAMIGDFGGGGMLMAFSMVSAILHAKATGRGQVIDCAMCEGAALLALPIYTLQAAGEWRDEREANLIDGGAHFYGVFETADGKYISIGAIEPQFYAQLLDAMGLSQDPDFAEQMDRARWPELRDRMRSLFRTRSREDWCDLMEGSDICFAPVLAISEARDHAHIRARGSFLTLDGIAQPAPAPRYSGTPLDAPRSPRIVG